MITSKSNDKIKYVNSLKNKKFRDKYNKYILEGIKLVDEYISSEGIKAPEFIVMSKSLMINNVGGENLYRKLCNAPNALEVDEIVFKFLTDTQTPQGVLIVIDKKENLLTNLLKNINNNENFLILDKVSDAGNVGTIIRTAVSFNVRNLICIKGSADVYSSKVVRSAMGALNKINIFYLDYNELLQVKDNLKEAGYKLIATDLNANNFLNEISPTYKSIYVVGNEANGVSIEIKNMCDDYVKIPMEVTQESLNVGIATAILLYDNYTRGDNYAG